MKAILCKELSGFKNLSLEEIEAPKPQKEEVLVDIHYTALNFADTLISEGRYQYKPELPFSPGGEIAGKISQNSPEHPNFKPGDRVLAYIGWNGLREQVSVKAESLIKIPNQVSDEAAASLIITYGTAMHGLVDRAKVKKNECVVVLGAAGGAGLAAVEIASALGAHVVAVASSDEKLALTQKYGAKETINSSKGDLKVALKALNNHQGPDVIYDCVGADVAEPALRSLKWDGQYLVVGFAGGNIPAIPLNLIMLKGIHVHGVFLARFIEEQKEDFKTVTKQLLDWVADKSLTPHIEEIFPLERTIEALGILADRKAKGKILIQMKHQE